MATMRRFWLVGGSAIALLTLAPVAAAAAGTETYQLRMGPAPNQGVAPNGDRVLVTCATRLGECGTFQVHSKDLPVPPAGEFVHTDATGVTILGAGTWVATELLAFDSYGCGVVTFPDPDVVLPPNFCGGMLRLRVLLTPTGAGFSLPGLLTVFCIVGPNPPNSHDDPLGEGVTLNIPGVINFNHTGGGQNVYVME